MDEAAAVPTTRYASADGVHVAYQSFGDGPPTILFITNWMTNLDSMWDEPGLAAYFRRLASFSRVVCFDKRGTGVSDPVPLDALPTLEQWMDDAVAAIDAAGVGEVAVVGDTEGGLMAILLAATFPERVSRLVLVNSFARWERADDYPIGMPAPTVDKLVARWQRNWGHNAEILSVTAPSLVDDERARRWFTRYQRLAMPPGAALAMYRWVVSVDVREVLPNISAPTLVLHRRDGYHHRVDFGRHLAANIPGAELVELEGGDTFPLHAGDPEPLLSAIERFLTGTQRASSTRRRLATVLVSDLVGSTAQAAEVGDDRWRERLRQHDALVRRALVRFRGEEIAHTGDGFVAGFDGPTRAVTCAQEIRDVLTNAGMPVRIGLHSGEIEAGPDGATGLAIHVATRVLAGAGAGVILVSQTVKDLVIGSPFDLEYRGEHILKGVPGRWRLYAVPG